VGDLNGFFVIVTCIAGRSLITPTSAQVGQTGLLSSSSSSSSSSGRTPTAQAGQIDDDDEDDDIKPVWPSLAMGALFRSATKLAKQAYHHIITRC
jgi:hypothetical protein